MKNILILCTGNSCRSQMAEGYLKAWLGANYGIYSAGISTHGVNPRAIQIMAEDGVDISNHTSNLMEEYLEISFDWVITVCDNAKEHCPIFPGTAQRLHQSFPDPAGATGSEEDIMASFRYTRDLIKTYLGQFVEEQMLVKP